RHRRLRFPATGDRDLRHARHSGRRPRCLLHQSRAGGRLLDLAPLSRAEIDEQNSYNLAMADYFHRLFELRRRAPGNDLTTRLVQAGENGNKLTNEELTANVILL